MRRSVHPLLLFAALIAGCTVHQPIPSQIAYRGGAVAADHIVASEAGVAILRAGGNAVDAAIATSFTLSVTDPFSCGVGGGGFMVVYAPATAQRSAVEAIVNYREVAPAAVDATFYPQQKRDDASQFGGTAVGIPGTVAGLWAAHQQWGSLPWKALLQPAISAAHDGVVANEAWCRAANWLGTARKDNPHTATISQWIWNNLCNGGDVQPGDVIRQPEQARLLRRIAGRGADFFYSGEVARDIVLAVESSGGVITVDDIEHYRPSIGPPLIADEHLRPVSVAHDAPPQQWRRGRNSSASYGVTAVA